MKYPALLRLADEELNNLMLFSLLLRVSTGVNKQLICSFCQRGQSRVIRRWADYFITYLTFSHNQFSSQQQSGTKLGLCARQENNHFTQLDCDQTDCLVRK